MSVYITNQINNKNTEIKNDKTMTIQEGLLDTLLGNSQKDGGSKALVGFWATITGKVSEKQKSEFEKARENNIKQLQEAKRKFEKQKKDKKDKLKAEIEKAKGEAQKKQLEQRFAKELAILDDEISNVQKKTKKIKESNDLITDEVYNSFIQDLTKISEKNIKGSDISNEEHMVNLLISAAIDKDPTTGKYEVTSLENFKSRCAGEYKEAFEKVVKDMGYNPNKNLPDEVYKSVMDRVTQTTVSSKSDESLQTDLETAKKESTDFERELEAYKSTQEALKEIEVKETKNEENIKKIKELTGSESVDFNKNIPNPLKDQKDSKEYDDLRQHVLTPTSGSTKLVKDDGTLNIEEVLSNIDAPSLDDTNTDEQKLEKVQNAITEYLKTTYPALGDKCSDIAKQICSKDSPLGKKIGTTDYSGKNTLGNVYGTLSDDEKNTQKSKNELVCKTINGVVDKKANELNKVFDECKEYNEKKDEYKEQKREGKARIDELESTGYEVKYTDENGKPQTKKVRFNDKTEVEKVQSELNSKVEKIEEQIEERDPEKLEARLKTTKERAEKQIDKKRTSENPKVREINKEATKLFHNLDKGEFVNPENGKIGTVDSKGEFIGKDDPEYKQKRIIASIRGFKPKDTGTEIKVTSDGKFYTKTDENGQPVISNDEQEQKSLGKKYSYQEANNQQQGEGISKLDKTNIKDTVKKLTDKVNSDEFDSLSDEEKEDLKAYRQAIQSLSTKEARELGLSDEKDMFDDEGEDWIDSDGYEDDDDEDANDGEDYDSDETEDDGVTKKKLTNPAKVWKRRKKKDGKGTTTNYYNVEDKTSSIPPKEYKAKMAKYKEAKQKHNEIQTESNSLTYSLRNNYLLEHNLRGYIKNKLK